MTNEEITDFTDEIYRLIHSKVGNQDALAICTAMLAKNVVTNKYSDVSWDTTFDATLLYVEVMLNRFKQHCIENTPNG